MKKLITLLLLSVATAAQAQFGLTPQGFTTADKKGYLVLEAEASQYDLYKATERYLHSIYTNPDKALSTIDGEMITIHAQQPQSVRRNKMHGFDMAYSISLAFKDGKVKVDAPSVELTAFTDKLQTLGLQGSNSLNGSSLYIWNNKGKLKSPLAKSDLEAFFNAFVADLEKALNTNDEW
tara:strand:+ start:122 stop:658 length:537 start_codon:yes stop_codon:yes gene_type:complete